ncbi:contractile injection system tape measure protein [Serratia ureilytica]|uniref:contractile injection system tape measure protein n=1 Tax=Serratia ureilytica TaxID=300181 RepID=UPI00313CCA5B
MNGDLSSLPCQNIIFVLLMDCVQFGVVRVKIKSTDREGGGVKLESLEVFSDGIQRHLSRILKGNKPLGEMIIDVCEIKLESIPISQFDVRFIPVLSQAIGEYIIREQASIVIHQAVMVPTPDVMELKDLLSEIHLAGQGLFQLACCCLTPSKLETLLQTSPAYQLQQLLKLLLEGAWQSPKILPIFWYGRVTSARLSLAAMLYLLKSQRGYDWLMHQHAPTASQVTDWAKAIDLGEIPPEQVMQLLAGNRPLSSILLGQQSTYPSLIVMRWLLPLWKQPSVRKVIHRLNGGGGVQRLDAYLSRCLYRQDNAIEEVQGGKTDHHHIALSRDNTTLPERKEMPSDTPQVDGTWMESGKMPAISRRTMPSSKGGIHSPNAQCSSSQRISNAGLLLLWPLLPQLFSRLGLWEEEQFVSDAARWQAVYGLDRLVWGEISPMEGRLTLNQVLCGVSCLTSVPPSMPLSLLQLQQVDDWLAAIGQQLPGWQKLSLTDIRQLFLQRAGEINMEEMFPQISVWSEPYDFLLRDWPWPMTLASFPWTEQPLTIVWPLDGFTG